HAADEAIDRPSSETEHAIAAVWREVLGVSDIGVHDNFFDLGGHSLLVPQVHRRLQQRVDAMLTMVDLFRHPTVSALAARVDGQTPMVDAFDASVSRAKMRGARRTQRLVRPKPGGVSSGRDGRTGA